MRQTPLQLIKSVPELVKLSDFELFWETYPKKKNKGDAMRAWLQTERERPGIEELLGAVEAACKTHAWTRDGGQFIPYPATWLRAWGWADEE